jgi:CubicO group peptidase (beta-lactamase class C family)
MLLKACLNGNRAPGAHPALPLYFQPGTRWKCSLSIDVIGHIVEIISGQSLDRFFEDNIFGSLPSSC